LGPRLATGNHAYTAQSARIAAEEAVESNPNRRLLIPLEDNENKLIIEGFLNRDGIIQRHYFPDSIYFPGDKDYDPADNPFIGLYGFPNTSALIPKSLLLLIPIPN